MQNSAFLVDEPAGKTRATLVLAHGAGAGMDTPFMTFMARRLSEGGVRAVRFEFPYMQQRRNEGRRSGPDRQPVLIESWKQAIANLGGGGELFIGGKSMGGRIASMVADEEGVQGLVCMGYPFHPPGRPQQLRTAHLVNLKTPTLIIQGERDPFGVPDEVEGYHLSKKIRVVWMPDGDHSFKPRKKSGRTEQQNWEAAAEAVLGFVGE